MARNPKLFVAEVINTHDQLVRAKQHSLPTVGIMLDRGPRGEGLRSVEVYSPLEATDPSNDSFHGRGKKVFPVLRAPGDTRIEKKNNAIEQAKAWASKKYGVKEWERNRWGEWVPAPLNSMYPLRRR